MKSLKIIQIIAKIGRIVSKIVCILCIVGAVSSLVSIPVLVYMKDYDAGGKSISQLIEESSDIKYEEMVFYLITAALFASAAIYLAYKTGKYFEHELAEGQPFTFALSKELRSLGILHIAVGFGTTVAAGIGLAIAQNLFPTVRFSDVSDFSSLSIGLTMLLASLLCQYGTERSSYSDKPPEDK